MEKSVLTEKKGKVTIITLNVPQTLNALEQRVRIELKSALAQFQNDETGRVAILTGRGKAFSAGGALEELKAGMDAVNGVSLMADYGEIATAIANLEKPVIAAVNGIAVGAGLSLALACDMVIASSGAVFAAVFSKVGFIPDMGATYYLPRAVGMHRAKELIFTSRMIKADEAWRMGIVNQVVNPDELEKRACGLAQQLAEGPGLAFGLTKRILARSLESNLQDMLQYETYAQSICFESQDHREGVRAFYEKRQPAFKGK